MTIKKTIHTYISKDPIQIKNNNNNIILIEASDLIQFIPKFNIKKEVEYTILQTKKNDQKVVDISFEVAKKINENSMKQLFTKKNIFQIDKDQQLIESLYETVKLYLQDLKIQLENKDMASNFLEINNYINNIIEEIKKIKVDEDNEEIDILNCQNGIDFFSQPQVLKLDNVNINTESYHKYVRSLEKYSFEFLIDAINESKLNYNKSEDDDLNTIEYTLIDFIDILRIAYYLNEDKVYDASQASNLDSYVRDGFDVDFYQNWYCLRDNELLKKQQQSNQQRKQLEKELKIKPIEKIKVKI